MVICIFDWMWSSMMSLTSGPITEPILAFSVCFAPLHPTLLTLLKMPLFSVRNQEYYKTPKANNKETFKLSLEKYQFLQLDLKGSFKNT